jgi:hypothetical protein
VRVCRGFDFFVSLIGRNILHTSVGQANRRFCISVFPAGSRQSSLSDSLTTTATPQQQKCHQAR